MTVADALRRGTGRLAAAGVPNAALDAEQLLGHVLGWDRARLISEPGRALSSEAAAHLERLLAERSRRRPLQHLTEVQAFWRHEFRVTPDVLIPRPETELLVEASLDLLRGRSTPVIVDVGAGSGCIALSLAAEIPDAIVHATDISEAALAVAKDNAHRLRLDGRVRFHAGDLLTPLAGIGLRFDVVVSNPPYVDSALRPMLQPEVRDYEPSVALFPPGEPYAVYRRLAPQATPALKENGWLVMEIGQGMEAEVRRICEGAGLSVERAIPDLQSIPRAVVARRNRP